MTPYERKWFTISALAWVGAVAALIVFCSTEAGTWLYLCSFLAAVSCGAAWAWTRTR